MELIILIDVLGSFFEEFEVQTLNPSDSFSSAMDPKNPFYLESSAMARSEDASLTPWNLSLPSPISKSILFFICSLCKAAIDVASSISEPI